MNIILGSGIIGLLARFMLGPQWKVIPFYRSRFFSFSPALDDNYIIRDERLDEFINDISKRDVPIHLYNRSWSFSGQLFKQYNSELFDLWLHKIFGHDVPSQSKVGFSDKMNFFVYDIRLNQLYQSLTIEYLDELKAEDSLGKVTEIGDHYLIRGGQRIDFDNMVSTIPLDVLMKLCNYNNNFKSKTLHYLHVETDDLDFEGANQVLVADQEIDFFKVTNIARSRYLFYCNNEIVNPGIYLMQFMQKFEIIDGTSINNVIPMGQIPDLNELEKRNGIFCVGSSAQWDWCMDISSCILRLMKYSQRGNKSSYKEFKVN